MQPSSSNPEPQRAATPSPHAPVREDWLALHREPILEPERAIIDPHHHLWDRDDGRYLLDEIGRDVGDGHRILATVFVQSRSMLRPDGPEPMRPLGEVEFANGIAAMSASERFGPTRVCAGIVGAADLRLGARVEPVIDAMRAAAGPRLVGMRNALAWHADPAVRSSTATIVPGALTDPAFHAGAAVLARHGLVLDIWAYHTQLDEIHALAAALPGLTIIIDHFGGPIGVGPYANERPRLMAQWSNSMKRLADLPNVLVKLGGAGMPVLGFGLHEGARPPDSAALAELMRPLVEPCVEWFGAERCMFESNFPVDKGSFSYQVVWNAFKRLAAGASEDEKKALFVDTATRTYKLAGVPSSA